MGSSLALLSVLCFAIAIALFIVEVFVPSGGLIGILAVIAAMTGIVLLFQINTTLGLIGAIVCVAAVPAMIMAALKLWPSTPFGRLISITNTSSQPTDDALAADKQSASESVSDDKHALVGKTGIAVTSLRPVGKCSIDGRKEPCVAIGKMIDAGTTVKVVAIIDNTIKVQVAD